MATLVAAIGAVVMAPAGHAQLPTCPPGTANALYCQTTGVQQPAATTVRGTALSANVCRARVTPLHLTETITAASGIRRVTVSLDGRRIKSQTSGHLVLTINTRGLNFGLHTIKITIVDKAGRTTTHRLRFRLCSALRVPTFTG
jgi:hypothetical protein